jgi:flagellar biosynthetic protein FlhB
VSDDKTEEPSHKRLQQAREDGNVAKSRDFSTAVIFGASCWLLPTIVDRASDQLSGFSVACFSATSGHGQNLSAACFDVAREGIIRSLLIILPLLGACFALALIVGFGMTGGLFTTKALMPKLDKMNPVSGIQNLFFSGKTYVELAKNLLKILVAGILGYKILSGALGDLIRTSRVPLASSVELTSQMIATLLKQIGGFIFAIGLFDMWYQHKTWYDGLKMSKQEQKDEHKQSEGDPHTKHARKKLAKELLNAKGAKDVGKAKAVVTNPHEIAVALEYEEGGASAPTILCKGERLVAQQIIEEAEKQGVPIMQNIALAHSLNQLEAGDEIPEELYEAVAEVLNYVYSMAEQQGQV